MNDAPFLFDARPIIALQELLGPGWREAWVVVSMLGTNWGIILAFGVAFWLWGRRVAYGLLAVVALEAAVKLAANALVPVARPDAAAIVKHERVDVPSFPSGHVSTATAVWSWLALAGRISWIVPITIAVLVSISRIYLGVHYVGDVLGGILIAAVTVALLHWLWPRVRTWLADRTFTFFAVAAALALAGMIAAVFFFFGSNPYRWRGGGLVAGLALGLLLEYRFVRYEPAESSFGRKAGMVLIGGLVVAGLAAIDQITGVQEGIVGLFLTALAALWAVLVAPTLFVLLGWSRRPDPMQERLVRRTGWALGACTLVLLLVMLYGVAIEPRLILDTEEQSVPIRGLPEEWNGAEVAVIADFQVGLWLGNTGMLRKAVAEIVRRDPDVVLLGGDFIYDAGARPQPEISLIIDILQPLVAARIPTFAVLGNHDWGATRRLSEGATPNHEAGRMLRQSLENVGIPVLHNRATAIYRNGASANVQPAAGAALYLVGIGSHYMDVDRPERAFAAIPDEAARIVLFHHPETFQELPAGTAPLAVAGHTHGGQIRLPFSPSWSWLTYTSRDEVHADGWIDEGFGRPGNRLYVNRGLGMSIVPMRINCPPELTIFTLRSAAAGAA